MVLREPAPLAAWGEIEWATSSAIARVECLRSLDRATQHGRAAAAEVAPYRGLLIQLLAGVALVRIDDNVLLRAGDPLPVPLRTLDALHLVTADIVRSQQPDLRVFATHDAELGLAARSIGFTVIGV